MDVNDQDELFCRVDRNDKLIGSMPRYLAHSHPKYIHRSICILVLNSKNELLFQKRSVNKDTYPEYWTLSTTGHVTYGQTYSQAARRELFEELGLRTKLKFLTKILLHLPQETEYCSIYKTQITNQIILLHQEEVSITQWVNPNLLNQFTSLNSLTPDALQILSVLKYL